MSNFKKIILYIIILCALAGAAWLGTVIFERTVPYDGEFTATVDNEIIIERSETGIPLVKASTIKDAFFSIGFLHGQDRLILIEYYRAITEGRLSEIIGEEALTIDRISRIMDFSGKADEIVKALKTPHMDYLDAYTYGINIAKQNLFEEISSFADIPAEGWAMKDVIAVLLMFDWADSFLNNRELLFPLPDSINEWLLKDVVPEEYLYTYSLEEGKYIDELKKMQKAVKNFIGSFNEGTAFFISGRRIKDGKSMIGFNMTESLINYPKWYPLYIEAGERRLSCITASGLPFILSGAVGDLSFTGFNLKIDAQDFHIETVKKIDGEVYYLSSGKWNKFIEKEETIYTDIEKTEKGARKFKIKYTDSGPVVNNISGESRDTYITLRYLSPDERYIESLFDLPFASSLKTAREELKDFATPKVYIFSYNNKALTAYAGKIPIRDIRGDILKKGARSEWKSVIDISEYGNITAGKDIITGGEYFELPGKLPEYTTKRDNNLYSRLESLIADNRTSGKKEVMNILKDTYSPAAEKFTPLFMSILENMSITSSRLTRIYFYQWDFRMVPESIPATIFNTQLINMMILTIEDDLGDYCDEFMENYNLIIDKFYRLMSEDKSFIFDDSRTKRDVETRNTIFRRAFLKSLRFLNEFYGPRMENWKWGGAHSGYYDLPLFSAGIFSDSERTGLRATKIHGGNSTISRGSISATNMLRAKRVTTLSAVFHDNSLFISPSFSCPVDPDSEYYKNYYFTDKFQNPGKLKGVHSLKIIPQSEKFEK